MNLRQDEKPTLSVIIPTHNRGDQLSVSIESILDQRVSGFKYEIVVVDNNSSDDTQLVVSDKSQSSVCPLRYVWEPKVGLIHGRHRGAKEAQGDLLVFCDDDIIASPHWLQSIYDAFKDPAVALVGGKILPKYLSEPPDWINQYWVRDDVGVWMFYLSLIDLGDAIKEIPANYVFGANFSIRKAVLRTCSGFHPDAFPRRMIHLRGDGEYGLAIKIMQKRLKTVYHPGAVVHHMVVKERMTPEYFIWRSFCQGISDSFTDLRQKGAASLPTQDCLKSATMDDDFIEHLLGGTFESETDSIPGIHKFIHYGYRQGVNYHRHLVNVDPHLHAYVVQESFISNDTSTSERSPMQSARSAHKQSCSNEVNCTDDTVRILKQRASTFIEKGRELFARCQFADALVQLNEAMYLVPNTPGLQYMRARCLMSIGRLKEAEMALQSELVPQADFEPALRLRSRLAQAKGLQDILAIPTKVTFDERLLLYALSARVPMQGVIVEVGSYIGASSCFMAEGSSQQSANIFCIDTWQNDAMPEAKQNTFEAFAQNTHRYRDRISPMRGESTQIASTFPHEIDLLFIDADHSYEGCRRDIQAWLPKLKENGIIVFHDYGWATGIQRAVGEFIVPVETQPGERLDSIYWTRVMKTAPVSDVAVPDLPSQETCANRPGEPNYQKTNSPSVDIQKKVQLLYSGDHKDLSWVDCVGIPVNSAVIYITDRCNSRCRTCTAWQNTDRLQELDTIAWKQILRDIRSCGISSVEFVGGEPLLRKDLPELAACAKNLGYSTILVSTNGALLNRNKLSNLVDAGVNSFHISLDGILNTYELIRGIDWYENVVSACQMISAARIPLMVLTTLAKQNIDELELIAALSHQFNAQWFVNIIENRKYHFKGIDLNQFQIAEPEEIQGTIEKLIHIRSLYPQTILLQNEDIAYIEAYLRSPDSEKDVPCTLGFNEVYLDAAGNLYSACMSLPPVGNMVSSSCTSILNSTRYRSNLKRMLQRRCTGCTCGYSQRAKLMASNIERSICKKISDVLDGRSITPERLTEMDRHSAAAEMVSAPEKDIQFSRTPARKLKTRDVTIDPSSNGHEDSKVFWYEGQVYRGLKGPKAAFYRDLMNSGFLSSFIDAGLIDTKIAPIAIDGFDLVLSHRKLPFNSFSFEWPVNMLKQGAMALIDLNITLARYGLQTIDAHNQNIIYDGTKPIFVDFSSITPLSLDKGIQDAWYREFAEYYYYPLLLTQFPLETRAAARQGAFLKVTKNELSKIMPVEEVNCTESGIVTRHIKNERDRIEFLLSIRDKIEAVNIELGQTSWSNYNDELSFDFDYNESWPERNKNIYQMLTMDQPDTLLDIGSNRSWYGQLAARIGSKVVAFDIDEPSLVKLYDDACRDNLWILPLVMNITDPTPPIIYKGKPLTSLSAESRFRCDTVLAFALVHHLVFKQHLTFMDIVSKIKPFVKRRLVIEFQPKEDKFVRQWWDHRYDWYTLDNFVSELKKEFLAVDVLESTPSPRKMISCSL